MSTGSGASIASPEWDGKTCGCAWGEIPKMAASLGVKSLGSRPVIAEQHLRVCPVCFKPFQPKPPTWADIELAHRYMAAQNVLAGNPTIYNVQITEEIHLSKHTANLVASYIERVPE